MVTLEAEVSNMHDESNEIADDPLYATQMILHIVHDYYPE